MALSKTVVGTDGIPMSYHRVVRIDSTVNGIVLVEVASYLDESARETQKSDIAAQSAGERMTRQLYIRTTFYQLPTSDGMTASDVYTWIKANVPEFEGAEDVWEEGQQEVAQK